MVPRKVKSFSPSGMQDFNGVERLVTAGVVRSRRGISARTPSATGRRPPSAPIDPGLRRVAGLQRPVLTDRDPDQPRGAAKLEPFAPAITL
jgi:hypothetical protein